MYTALLIVHVFIAAALIGLVLIQHGKGADAGAAFGSGASGTVFGSRGASSFLSRTTALLAAGFFVTSLVLAMLAAQAGSGGSSVVDAVPADQQAQPAQEQPAAGPAPAPAGEQESSGSAPGSAGQSQQDIPPPPAE